MNKAAVVLAWFQINAEYAPRIMLMRRKAPCKGWVDFYSVAGGSIEPGEQIIQAAQREFKEEAGIWRPSHEFVLIDCLEETDFKCFYFDIHFSEYTWQDVRHTESDKHTPWKLYSINQALQLKLIPRLRDIILTKQKEYAKLKQYEP